MRFAGMIRPFLTAFAALALLPALPALAQSASPAPTASAISSAVPANDDARIAQRIRGIYSEIAALRPVQVRVSQGVVTLSGTLNDADAIAQAVGIAGRVSGVVTVQNRLQRNLKVETNLSPALAGVKKKGTELVQAAPLLGVAIVIALLVGWLGYAVARRKTLWQRLAPNPFLAEVIATAIRLVFVVAGIVLALDIVGATGLLGAVLGGAGVIGIAVGFAVRDTIDNYISSLMLSVRQPFRANDSVSIDGKEGRVLRMNSRATILITPDGNHLRISNSAVFRAVIINYTINPQRRFQFDIPIDVHADLACAVGAALGAVKAEDFVLKNPEPKVEIADVAGTNPVLRVFGWVDQTDTDLGKARTVVIESVAAALHEGGYAVSDTVHKVRLEQQQEAKPVAAPSPPPPKDVAPEDHVKSMVEEERQTKKDGKDLLDSTRPTE